MLPVNTPTKKSIKPLKIFSTSGINFLIRSPHDLKVSLNDPTIKSTIGDKTLSHTQLIASPIALIPGFHVSHISSNPSNAIARISTRKLANGIRTLFQIDKTTILIDSTALTNTFAINEAIGVIIVVKTSAKNKNNGFNTVVYN